MKSGVTRFLNESVNSLVVALFVLTIEDLLKQRPKRGEKGVLWVVK